MKQRFLAALIWLARQLPVGWLRRLNQRMHDHPRARRVLNRVWSMVGDAPAVIPRGPLAGWTFASGGGQPGYLLGASEPDLQAALQQRIGPGDVFYDIGANVGFFTLLGARLATSAGHVYAFEPMDTNVRALHRNLTLNNVRHVTVVRAAVCDAVGSVQMSFGSNQATGHLARPEEGDLIDVSAVTVDDFVRNGALPPSIVKIDVEGAENLVFGGMRETLRQHRPVVLCELHYRAGDPRRASISDLLNTVGYVEQALPLDGGSMPHLLAVPRG